MATVSLNTNDGMQPTCCYIHTYRDIWVTSLVVYYSINTPMLFCIQSRSIIVLVAVSQYVLLYYLYNLNSEQLRSSYIHPALLVVKYEPIDGLA